MDANEQIQFAQFVFSTFEKTIHNVSVIHEPFVGFSIHRFRASVQDRNAENINDVSSVLNVMSTLKPPISTTKLRYQTSLKP